MGKLVYGASVTEIDIDDRTLAHLEIVIIAKLRRDEKFVLSWQHGQSHLAQGTDGRGEQPRWTPHHPGTGTGAGRPLTDAQQARRGAGTSDFWIHNGINPTERIHSRS